MNLSIGRGASRMPVGTQPTVWQLAERAGNLGDRLFSGKMVAAATQLGIGPRRVVAGPRRCLSR